MRSVSASGIVSRILVNNMVWSVPSPEDRLCVPFAGSGWLHLCQRLVKVGQQIIRILDADAQAHKFV